jgi:hypothetical protein
VETKLLTKFDITVVTFRGQDIETKGSKKILSRREKY